jgi:succinate-semialdehyde dehydrogenase/glutarate-semialdehyde dehydrogenase
MYGELGLFIDGTWRKNGSGNKGEDVINPATEKPLAHLPHVSTADLDEALESAKKGFAVWRATSAYDRSKIMHKAADLMRERHDAIAKIMVLEQGKPYPEARGEVIGSADIIDWYAERRAAAPTAASFRAAARACASSWCRSRSAWSRRSRRGISRC